MVSLLALLPPFGLFAEEKAKSSFIEVEEVMDVCGANPELKLHASIIHEAAIKRWPDNEKARRWWYILLCMESGFNPNVKDSPAGAVGIGQIMPQYAAEFALYCKITPPSLQELRTIKVNTEISSCRYKQLFDMFAGNAALSLAAYNAGVNSKDIERIKKNKTRLINRETMGYLALAFSLQQALERLYDDTQLYSNTPIGDYFP